MLCAMQNYTNSRSFQLQDYFAEKRKAHRFWSCYRNMNKHNAPSPDFVLINCILCEKPHTSTWKGIPGTWKAVYPLATSPILGCGTKRRRICTRHNISPTTYGFHGTDSRRRSLHFQSFEFLSSPIMLHCRWRWRSVSSPFHWTFPTAFPVIMLLHARHRRKLLLA